MRRNSVLSISPTNQHLDFESWEWEEEMVLGGWEDRGMEGWEDELEGEEEVERKVEGCEEKREVEGWEKDNWVWQKSEIGGERLSQEEGYREEARKAFSPDMKVVIKLGDMTMLNTNIML